MSGRVKTASTVGLIRLKEWRPADPLVSSDSLEAFVDECLTRLRLNRYPAYAFRELLAQHGDAVWAITKLVIAGPFQSGLYRLRDLRLLDWSAEAAVIRFPHRFDEVTVNCARFRLFVLREKKQPRGQRAR